MIVVVKMMIGIVVDCIFIFRLVMMFVVELVIDWFMIFWIGLVFVFV